MKISRWLGEEERWLRVIRKTTVVPAKEWPEHGELIDTEMGGGGYHGRCCNCHLALVTDLGYMSWDNTTCKKSEKKSVEITSWRWFKDKKMASVLSEKEMSDIFSDLITNYRSYNYSKFTDDYKYI